MPYIKQNHRDKFTKILDGITYRLITGPGDLNYLITMIIKDYVQASGDTYATFNEVVGVLECVKQEFYRRDVTTYEEKKIKENGDI